MYISRIVEKSVIELIDNPKVLILLGARQVGKTTLIEPIVKARNGLLLNCDLAVDRARLLAASTLLPHEALQLLGNPPLLVIDEAQNLPEIGRIVKGWYDARIGTKIVLLGSSSLNILDQSAEPLTGRNEKIFLTPLLFKEVIKTQPWFSAHLTQKLLEEKFNNQLQTLLLQQMVFGSYPEAITTDDKEKYLLNLSSDYILRDVLHGGLVKSPEPVKRLLSLLAYQIGKEVSTNEIANSLQLSRITVDRYIELLERSYVIFRLHAFSTNQRKEIAKNTKIYFWDTGIRNALLKEFSFSPTRSDIGVLFENWVISEVAKQNLLDGNKRNIYFWRKRDGAEVDLVIKGASIFKACEIKWSKLAGTASSKGFTASYSIPVEVINRERVLSLLWNKNLSNIPPTHR